MPTSFERKRERRIIVYGLVTRYGPQVVNGDRNRPEEKEKNDRETEGTELLAACVIVTTVIVIVFRSSET